MTAFVGIPCSAHEGEAPAGEHDTECHCHRWLSTVPSRDSEVSLRLEAMACRSPAGPPEARVRLWWDEPGATDTFDDCPRTELGAAELEQLVTAAQRALTEVRRLEALLPMEVHA